MNVNHPRPVDGDTLFEIGSITKVFTSLVLADMVERGEVALGDPVVRYLPAGVEVPERNGGRITLLDLATHRSGLPRFEIFPEGDFEKGNNDFFSKTADVLVTFEFDSMAPALASQLTFRRGFLDPRRGKRIE